MSGATIINTGIGWHEARVPTIVTSVPNSAFVDISNAMAEHVSIPVVASNRINMPQAAEQILAEGHVQLISMARPLLSDPDWVRKAEADAADEINTCIACNQACLDHAFVHKTVSCLLNPRAGHETKLVLGPTRRAKRVAVVGAGPAGLATAVSAAQCGHRVTLFEAGDVVGGQFDLARRIPGKEEFSETLRYYTRMLDKHDVDVRLQHAGDGRRTGRLRRGGAGDRGVAADARHSRHRPSDGALLCRSHHRQAGRQDGGRRRRGRNRVRRERVPGDHAGRAGRRIQVAVNNLKEWKAEWGVADPQETRGALTTPIPAPAAREVYLLQRTKGPQGKGLGKTSGWVHRASLKAKGVQQLSGVNYERIDDDGLHITFGSDRSTRACSRSTTW